MRLLRPVTYCAVMLISICHVRAQVSIGPNVLVSGTLPHPNEVSIAIHRFLTNTLVAGSNLFWIFNSTDQGETWSIRYQTSPWGVWGDPFLLSDGDGRIYYAHLSGDHPLEINWLDRIVVQVSYDGGQTFLEGAWTGLNPFKDQDKEWLSCDYTKTSPYWGNIYLSWTEFDSYGSNLPTDSSRILFSRSTDAAVSWVKPKVVSDESGDCVDMSNTVEGATTAVGPNGDVYISWAGPKGIYFDRTTNGGQTFGKDTVLLKLIPGWYFNVEGVSRCNGFPTTFCDVSKAPTRGNLYIMFSDQRNGFNNVDVFLLRSRDGGNTWDPIKRVNNDATTRDQFFPAITIDQTTGVLYVVYYDRRNTEGAMTEVYLSRSVDGGETFTDTLISQEPFEAVDTVFLGDYIHIDAHEGHIYPIWTRIDDWNRTSIWMTHIVDSAAFASVPPQKRPAEFKLHPNPARSEITVSGVDQYTELVISDALGREVTRVNVGSEQDRKLSITTWPPGVYYYSIKNRSERLVKPLVVIR